MIVSLRVFIECFRLKPLGEIVDLIIAKKTRIIGDFVGGSPKKDHKASPYHSLASEKNS